MNLKIYQKRRLISAIIAGVYLFTVLFSSYFHKHSTFFLKEGVSLKKTSPNPKLNGADNKDTCLLSHTSNGAVLIHEQEKISFDFSKILSVKIHEGKPEDCSLRTLFTFSLRGPPMV